MMPIGLKNMNKVTFVIASSLIVALSVVFYVYVRTTHIEDFNELRRTKTKEFKAIAIQQQSEFPHFVPLNAGSKQGAQKLMTPHSHDELSSTISNDVTINECGELASEKNQIMDELLNQAEIPSDYGATMVALYRDSSQDVVTRDFAVQHIGLCAQALERQGAYNPDSTEAADCRAALFDAAKETQTIIAAAAFRALADIAEFDPKVNEARLDLVLINCVSDNEASVAARVMAVQICGERKVASSRFIISRINDDKDIPEPLSRAAKWAMSRLDETE